MSKAKRFVAAILVGAFVGMAAPSALAAPECSPGQQGNPHPGFKPGSCK
jgi:hypothetical protein